MKKTKYFLHLLIPIVLYFPYIFVNSKILVDVFGCGCLKYREPPNNVNMLGNQFNANDFTALFWWLIAFVLIVISIIISFKIRDNKRKYLICSILLSLFLSFLCLFFYVYWRHLFGDKLTSNIG